MGVGMHHVDPLLRWAKPCNYLLFPTRNERDDMRESEHKNIDGVDYTCEMMPGTLAQKTLVELTLLLGRPLLVSLAKGFTGEGEVEIDELADAATLLLSERLNAESSDRLIKATLQGVTTSGAGYVAATDAAFDTHFRGRILHLYKVFAWSLEVNYRDFFDGALSSPLLEKAKQAAKRAYHRSTSTLGSGTSSTSETTSTSET